MRAYSVIAAIGVLASLGMAQAAGPPGPAISATQRWYSTDRTLGCVDPDGHDVLCSAANTPSFQIYYGNADGGPGQPDALAFVHYLSDPTGNAENIAVAVLRQQPTGEWRMARVLPKAGVNAVAPGSTVRFGHGRATWDMVALRPMDSRTMPTGRRQVSFAIR